MSPADEVEFYDTLDGQVCLVTGANRGIGYEVARRLDGLGAEVWAGVREPDGGDGMAEGPDGRAGPPGTSTVALDVTDEARVEEAIVRVWEEAGRLDVVVNNAGVLGPKGPLHRLTSDKLDHVWTTNLRGPALVTKHALPALLDRDGGRVVNVSSGAGSFGEAMMPSHLPYCTSKAALNALTFLLDAQYADRGLMVNAVCPGWVRTDMGGRGAARSVETGAETPVWLARLRPGGPSGRFWRDREEIPW